MWAEKQVSARKPRRYHERGSAVVGMAVLCFVLVGLLGLISTHATVVDKLLNDRSIRSANIDQALQSYGGRVLSSDPSGRGTVDMALMTPAFENLRAISAANGQSGTANLCGWVVKVVGAGENAVIAAYEGESYNENCFSKLVDTACLASALKAHAALHPGAAQILTEWYACLTNHDNPITSRLVTVRKSEPGSAAL